MIDGNLAMADGILGEGEYPSTELGREENRKQNLANRLRAQEIIGLFLSRGMGKGDLIFIDSLIDNLTKERDEWKSNAEAQAKIIQDMNDLTIKLTDSLGSQIGEANRILNRFRKTNPFVEDLQTWNEIVKEANEHLSQYQNG